MFPARPDFAGFWFARGKSPLLPRLVFGLALLGAALSPVARGGDADSVVAVYSSVSAGYERPRGPDGKFKSQTYAFGEGGLQGGARVDATLDKIRFADITQIVAPALAAQAFVPCDTKNPRATDLLIVVYWGATAGTDGTSSSAEYQMAQSLAPLPSPPPPPPPPDGTGGTAMTSDPSCSGRAGAGELRAVEQAAAISALDQSLTLSHAANRQRERQNAENAAIIGYSPEMKRVATYTAPALQQRRQDVVNEVEESRYFVVLLAYDFQSLWRHKQKKLLWETRFSVPERRRDFTKDLPAMVAAAQRYFGQNSGGLVRSNVREGKVEIGEIKSLGAEK